MSLGVLPSCRPHRFHQSGGQSPESGSSIRRSRFDGCAVHSWGSLRGSIVRPQRQQGEHHGGGLEEDCEQPPPRPGDERHCRQHQHGGDVQHMMQPGRPPPEQAKAAARRRAQSNHHHPGQARRSYPSAEAEGQRHERQADHILRDPMDLEGQAMPPRTPFRPLVPSQKQALPSSSGTLHPWQLAHARRC